VPAARKKMFILTVISVGYLRIGWGKYGKKLCRLVGMLEQDRKCSYLKDNLLNSKE
jgi:hypothetical protein